MKVRPNPDLKLDGRDAVIRDPHTKRPLPPEGAEVPDSSFWIRRLRSGDVILIEEAAPATPRDLAPTTPLQTRSK